MSRYLRFRWLSAVLGWSSSIVYVRLETEYVDSTSFLFLSVRYVCRYVGTWGYISCTPGECGSEYIDTFTRTPSYSDN